MRAAGSTWSSAEIVPASQRHRFSPDYKKLYVVSTGKPAIGPVARAMSFDVGGDNKVSNRKQFSDFMVDGVRADGRRARAT